MKFWLRVLPSLVYIMGSLSLSLSLSLSVCVCACMYVRACVRLCVLIMGKQSQSVKGKGHFQTGSRADIIQTNKNKQANRQTETDRQVNRLVERLVDINTDIPQTDRQTDGRTDRLMEAQIDRRDR